MKSRAPYFRKSGKRNEYSIICHSKKGAEQEAAKNALKKAQKG